MRAEPPSRVKTLWVARMVAPAFGSTFPSGRALGLDDCAGASIGCPLDVDCRPSGSAFSQLPIGVNWSTGCYDSILQLDIEDDFQQRADVGLGGLPTGPLEVSGWEVDPGPDVRRSGSIIPSGGRRLLRRHPAVPASRRTRLWMLAGVAGRGPVAESGAPCPKPSRPRCSVGRSRDQPLGPALESKRLPKLELPLVLRHSNDPGEVRIAAIRIRTCRERSVQEVEGFDPQRETGLCAQCSR